MFSFVRLLIGCICFGGIIRLIKKSKLIHKRIWYIIATIVSIVLVVALAFLPFENLFINFNSYKTAYEYFNFGKSNIELVIEGTDCDFVIDCQNDIDTYLIIPKTEDGWKVGIGFYTKRIIQKIQNGIVVSVYQYKNTSDYFITVFDTNGGASIVSDDYNTEFFSLEKNNAYLGKTFITYYAHIPNYNSQYVIMVNDNKIRTN